MAQKTTVVKAQSKKQQTAAPKEKPADSLVTIDSKTGAKVETIENARGQSFPVLNLEPGKDKFGVSLGVRKIRLVLEHLSECVVFVNSGGKKCK